MSQSGKRKLCNVISKPCRWMAIGMLNPDAATGVHISSLPRRSTGTIPGTLGPYEDAAASLFAASDRASARAARLRWRSMRSSSLRRLCLIE